MQIKEIIKGDRIIIRDQYTTDLSFVESHFFDPETNQYTGDPLREFADENYYNALSEMENNEDGYYLIIQLKDSDEPIGTCCMFPNEDGTSYDIGYTISRSKWRQGYGAEAIELLLQRIIVLGGKIVTCEVAVDNTSSNALIKKMGFFVDRETEFKKWNMDIKYKSYIYKLEL
jgi:ribosomal-protein-alanine N-acetyltransferase